MSLIGKKVKVSVSKTVGYSSMFVMVDGVVLDKYLKLTLEDNVVPSGIGGKMTISTKMNEEYYIIKTNDGIEHVKCSYIKDVFNEFIND